MIINFMLNFINLPSLLYQVFWVCSISKRYILKHCFNVMCTIDLLLLKGVGIQLQNQAMLLAS